MLKMISLNNGYLNIHKPIDYSEQNINDNIGRLITITNKTYIDSFYLMGYQPQNTMRKVIFEVDGVWNKFNELGLLDPVTTQTPTTDSILDEGNTIDEIALLKDIVPFRGKQVRVAVAMSLQDDTVPTPTLRIGVLAR